jgi:hypothetical protein
MLLGVDGRSLLEGEDDQGVLVTWTVMIWGTRFVSSTNTAKAIISNYGIHIKLLSKGCYFIFQPFYFCYITLLQNSSVKQKAFAPI